MKQLFFTISILFLIACSNNKEYKRYIDFPEEKKLTGKTIELDTAIFRYPFRVTVKDHVAIVLDMHNKDNYLHAFTYPEWKHIVSFGKKGEAPKEMLSAETLCFYSLDSVWVLDPNKSQIIRWSVSPESNTANQEEVVKLDKRLVRTLDFHPTETGFIVPDYLGESRYCWLNAKGTFVKSDSKIPSEKRYKRIHELIVAQGWRSYIDYHSQKNILVIATQLGEVLEIHNLKDSIHTVHYGQYGEPQFQIEHTEMIPTGIMGFSDIKMTDHYIYAVFHGRKFEDIMASYRNGIKPESGGIYIYVFDLEGKPVRKYTLDRAVYGIDVDEKTNTIIATDVNGSEPIVKFDMN